jgi:hypothetical protein
MACERLDLGAEIRNRPLQSAIMLTVDFRLFRDNCEIEVCNPIEIFLLLLFRFISCHNNSKSGRFSAVIQYGNQFSVFLKLKEDGMISRRHKADFLACLESKYRARFLM